MCQSLQHQLIGLVGCGPVQRFDGFVTAIHRHNIARKEFEKIAQHLPGRGTVVHHQGLQPKQIRRQAIGGSTFPAGVKLCCERKSAALTRG